MDLDYHFRHSALPSPGGDRALGVLISRLHSRPLDPTRPLWEVHLIEGLENDRFALFVKAHHALMDGVGATRRIFQMLGPDPDDDTIRPIWSLPVPGRRKAKAAAGGSTGDRVKAILASARESALVAGELTKATGQLFKEVPRRAIRSLRSRSSPRQRPG